MKKYPNELYAELEFDSKDCLSSFAQIWDDLHGNNYDITSKHEMTIHMPCNSFYWDDMVEQALDIKKLIDECKDESDEEDCLTDATICTFYNHIILMFDPSSMTIFHKPSTN